MTPLRPGIHPGISAERYHADPAPAPSLSSTLARALIFQSPRHAWTAHPRLNPGWQPDERETFDIGRAAHTALLTVGQGIRIVDAPDWRGKDARAERDAARKDGLTPILAHQADAVRAMAGAVRSRLTEMGMDHVFADPAAAEVAALAEIDGCWCRCMVDWVGDGAIWDLKTTTDASPEAVRRAVEGYGYHVQATHYLETWRAAGGDARRVRFVFVEKTPPHEAAVVELVDDIADPSDWGEIARAQVAEARALWRDCLASGEWSGYPPEVIRIGAPAWVAEKWEERRAILGASKPSAAAMRAAAEMQAP